MDHQQEQQLKEEHTNHLHLNNDDVERNLKANNNNIENREEEEDNEDLTTKLARFASVSIPPHRRRECMQLLYTALQSKSCSPDSIKPFFARLIHVMEEEDVLALSRIIRHELLWFLAIFCKTLCGENSRFRQSDVTYNVLIQFLENCCVFKVDNNEVDTSVVSKMATFLLARVASILNQSNFYKFVRVLTKLRGSMAICGCTHLGHLKKKVEDLWIKYWDGCQQHWSDNLRGTANVYCKSLTNPVDKLAINGYVLLCEHTNCHDGKLIMEYMSFLDESVYLKILDCVQRPPDTGPLIYFHLQMLNYWKEERHLLLVNELLVRSLEPSLIHKFIFIFFDTSINAEVRDRVSCLLKLVLPHSRILTKLFLKNIPSQDLSSALDSQTKPDFSSLDIMILDVCRCFPEYNERKCAFTALFPGKKYI